MDLLVKLYEIPVFENPEGVTIRRAKAPECHLVDVWVREHFSAAWASECHLAFSFQPIRCFLAVGDGELLGFACINATFKGYFGPTGVCDKARNRGLGRALLLRSLHAMHEDGYAYAIIGGAGEKNVEFYEKSVNATRIEGSTPGAYRGMLRSE